MDMMKDLYQTGDEEMKRTIAESWSKTQQEKAGSGLRGPEGIWKISRDLKLDKFMFLYKIKKSPQYNWSNIISGGFLLPVARKRS